jgi:hypothetical protein
MSAYALLSGELREWPSKEQLAAILRAAGLNVIVGRYSLRLPGMSHFVFQQYGGDLGDPQIEADADTPELLAHEAGFVSRALADADIVHRFEIYREGDGDPVYYLHHLWPMK